jgi:hypothetical protein
MLMQDRRVTQKNALNIPDRACRCILMGAVSEVGISRSLYLPAPFSTSVQGR